MPTPLRVLAPYVPSFFLGALCAFIFLTYLTCLFFYRALSSFIFLRALRALAFLSVSIFFFPVLHALTFPYKI